jgi:hypothetical protein
LRVKLVGFVYYIPCFPSSLTAAAVILIHLLLSARAVEGMAIPSRSTKLMRGSQGIYHAAAYADLFD